MSFLNQVLELVIGMATERVWDGRPLPHFPPGYIIFSHPRPKPGVGRVGVPHAHLQKS